MASISSQHKHPTFLCFAPHLSHLYHPVTFLFFVDFSFILGTLVPHQPRRHLQLNSDAYSEHRQTSKMELFPKTVNSFKTLWGCVWGVGGSCFDFTPGIRYHICFHRFSTFNIIKFVQTNICVYKTKCKKRSRYEKFLKWYGVEINLSR